MKKVDRMGVYVLVSHLIITIAVIVLYGLFAYIGKPVTTIENMLLVIIGYWFGAIGATQVRPTPPTTQINQASEVKVTPENGTNITTGGGNQ
jgi:uncharacterized membrane protein